MRTSNSHLPIDMTPTTGTTYGLEGYEDMDYGSGLSNANTFVDGIDPALPTGLSKGSSGHMDLQAMCSDTGLSNLTWLEEAVQDIGRLPKSPIAQSIPELEDAWGKHRPTNGILVPAIDPNFILKEATPKSRSSLEERREVVRAASRAMARGLGIDIIQSRIKLSGMSEDSINKVIAAMTSDRHLLGHVYLRLSAYPQYAQGKWASYIKKHHGEVPYLIATESEIRSASWIHKGRCNYTGKRVVVEVPWKQAYQVMLPNLKLAGFPVESVDGESHGAYREAIRTAIARGVHVTPITPKHHVVNSSIVESISIDEARRVVRATNPSRVEILPKENPASKHASKIRAKLTHMVHSGMLDVDTYVQILKTSKSPDEMMHRAMRASAPKTADYRGTGKSPELVMRDTQAPRVVSDVHVRTALLDRILRMGWIDQPTHSKWASSNASLESVSRLAMLASRAQRKGYNAPVYARHVPLSDVQDPIDLDVVYEKKVREARVAQIAKENPQRTKLLRHLADLHRRGLITAATRDSYARMKIAAKDVMAMVAKELLPKAREYQGVAQHREANLNRTSTISLTASQVMASVQWVRRAMTEGMAGKTLDELIQRRFASDVLSQIQGHVDNARHTHEGGSGFHYVDAGAYETQHGLKGCESGALKHRANGIKMLMAMEKCGSCTMVRDLADGSRKCGVYGKILIDPSMVGDALKEARMANICASDMTDHEQTASLFAPSYQNDLNLTSASLHVPPPIERESMTEVLMGGWYLGALK
jgi:hypothetical protein